jgi:hypothetical protein
MTHLINKDILVAEIENYISAYRELLAKTDRNDHVWIDFVSQIEAKINVLQHLLIFLDTLEAKEIDLKEELRDFVVGDIDDYDMGLAKHFFELGLKAAQNEHKSCTTNE